MTVRTRFAPSPTGLLHVGSTRTALYAWLYARQHNGALVLRIEDTDKAREMEGAIGHIMESLRWLGIDWDEGTDKDGPYGPYIQSARLPIYVRYARQLLQAGHAYPDLSTESDREAYRKEAEQAGKPFLMRKYRPERITEWNGRSPLRFKVPKVKRFAWHDLVLGDLSAGEEALDDFIILKHDGYPTYNFAHVVDDIEMQISHVMRGQEFLASTPKYLSLYEALDQPPPVFVTLPPILGEGGTKKLSKREGAQDVLDYRTQGYLPEALFNFLALLGWHPPGNNEILTREELLRIFDIERVQKGGAQFDLEKLNHINREHLKHLTDKDFLKKAELSAPDTAVLTRALPTIRERAHTFSEARDLLLDEFSFLFKEPEITLEKLVSKTPGDEPNKASREHLEAISGLLEPLHEEAEVEAVKVAVMPYADAIPKEQGGRGAALWPLRYALSGKERSPDPFILIHALGKKESLSRIQRAIAILTT